MKTVHLFTNIASHYRASIWAKLLESPILNVVFYFGDQKGAGIKRIDMGEEPFSDHKHKLHRIRNIWLKKKLVWQKSVIKNCLTKDFNSAIFLGEAHIVSNWVAAIICRVRNVEVIFWGHGLYGNEGRLKLIFRKLVYRLADKHLLYERRAKRLMIENGFNPDKLYVIFNSLDYDLQKELREKYSNIDPKEVFDNLASPNQPILIFISRLRAVKKLDLLIKAVNKINHQVSKVNLVVIGDGPDRSRLEALSATGINEGWIRFLGACYDEEKIAQYLSAADLCISPGNVGLTAIHSLGYGTPVATHDDLSNQMPEAEAITDGYNGFLFQKDNGKDLQQNIEQWFEQDMDEDELRERCFEIIDMYYNPEYQLSVFERALGNNKPVNIG